VRDDGQRRGRQAQAMRIVPGFDVVNGVWFVWEPKGLRVKARTLAELQRKLPADAVIEVYYPDGYPFEVARDNGTHRPQLDLGEPSAHCAYLRPAVLSSLRFFP
jgi:hypothetical protein